MSNAENIIEESTEVRKISGHHPKNGIQGESPMRWLEKANFNRKAYVGISWMTIALEW